MEWALRVGVFLRLPSGSKHSQGWEPLLFSYTSPDTPCVILCAGADLPPSLFLWLIPSHPHPTQESFPSGSPPAPLQVNLATDGLPDYSGLAFIRAQSFCIMIAGLLHTSPSLGLEFLSGRDFIIPPCIPGAKQALAHYRASVSIG